MRNLRRNALIVGVVAVAALALGTMPAAAGSTAAGPTTTGSAAATKARPVATAKASAGPTTAPATAPAQPAPGGPAPSAQPTSAAGAAPAQPGPASPGAPVATAPPVDTAPLLPPPGVTADTPPEPHVITNFADQLKGERRGPAPARALSVPVRADVDGCDRNYGETAQCVPNVLPGGQTDVCAYLAQRGIKGVKVKGADRKELDRNRNGVVCD